MSSLQIVWLETPTNPLMKVVDIAAIAKIAHQQGGVIVVVDNTFMSSYFQVSSTSCYQCRKYCHKHQTEQNEYSVYKNPLGLLFP